MIISEFRGLNRTGCLAPLCFVLLLFRVIAIPAALLIHSTPLRHLPATRVRLGRIPLIDSIRFAALVPCRFRLRIASHRSVLFSFRLDSLYFLLRCDFRLPSPLPFCRSKPDAYRSRIRIGVTTLRPLSSPPRLPILALTLLPVLPRPRSSSSRPRWRTTYTHSRRRTSSTTNHTNSLTNKAQGLRSC
jgi:hypothetical protein